MLKPMMVRLAEVKSAEGILAGNAGSVAVANQPAIGRDATEAFLQHRATDTFQHQLDTAAAGEFLHPFLKVFLGVVDGFVGAQGTAEFQLVGGGGGGYDAGAPRLGQLGGDGANAGGAGLD